MDDRGTEVSEQTNNDVLSGSQLQESADNVDPSEADSTDVQVIEPAHFFSSTIYGDEDDPVYSCAQNETPNAPSEHKDDPCLVSNVTSESEPGLGDGVAEEYVKPPESDVTGNNYASVSGETTELQPCPSLDLDFFESHDVSHTTTVQEKTDINPNPSFDLDFFESREVSQTVNVQEMTEVNPSPRMDLDFFGSHEVSQTTNEQPGVETSTCHESNSPAADHQESVLIVQSDSSIPGDNLVQLDNASDHEEIDTDTREPDISEMDAQFLEDMGILAGGHGDDDDDDGHDTDTETDIQTGILATKKPPPPRPPAPAKPKQETPSQPKQEAQPRPRHQVTGKPQGAPTSRTSSASSRAPSGAASSSGKGSKANQTPSEKSGKVLNKIHKAADKAHVVGQIVKASLKETIKVPKDPNANPNLKKLRKKKLAKGDDLESVVKSCDKVDKAKPIETRQKSESAKESEEYQKFQAIEERIKVTVQQSQESIAKLQTRAATTESEGEKAVSWVSFDDAKMSSDANAWGEVETSADDAKGFDDDFSDKITDHTKPQPAVTKSNPALQSKPVKQTKKALGNATSKRPPSTRKPATKPGPPRPKPPSQTKGRAVTSKKDGGNNLNKATRIKQETSYTDDVDNIENLDLSMRSEVTVPAEGAPENESKLSQSTTDLLGIDSVEADNTNQCSEQLSILEKELLGFSEADQNDLRDTDDFIDTFLGVSTEKKNEEAPSPIEGLDEVVKVADEPNTNAIDTNVSDITPKEVSKEPNKVHAVEVKRHRSAQKPKEIDASIVAKLVNAQQTKKEDQVVAPALIPQPSVDEPEFAEFLSQRRDGSSVQNETSLCTDLLGLDQNSTASGVKSDTVPSVSDSDVWGETAEHGDENFASELVASLQQSKEFTGNLFSDRIEEIPPELEQADLLEEFLGQSVPASKEKSTGDQVLTDVAENNVDGFDAFLLGDTQSKSVLPDGDDLDPFAPSKVTAEKHVDPFFRSFSQTIVDDDLDGGHLNTGTIVEIDENEDNDSTLEEDEEDDDEDADDEEEEEDDDDEDEEVEEENGDVKEIKEREGVDEKDREKAEEDKNKSNEQPKRTKIIPVEPPKPIPTSVKPIPRPKKKDGKFEVIIKDLPDSVDSQNTPLLVPPPPPKIQPPKSPEKGERFNPFNKDVQESSARSLLDDKQVGSDQVENTGMSGMPSDSNGPQENVTPLSVGSSMDDDLDEPLPVFHPPFTGDYWQVMLRLPTKKHSSFSKFTNTMNAMTNKRFWKEVFLKLVKVEDKIVLKTYNKLEELRADKMAVQEIPLQPCYSLSAIFVQQFDQYGKIHTFKLQYVCFKERVGVRTDRLSEAIPSFIRGHTKPKPNMILEHTPQSSEVLKFGAKSIENIQSLLWALEDEIMRLPAKREKSLAYTKDEITVEVIDEYRAEINKLGRITSQISRLRMFCLAFLTGDPTIEIGINDKRRDGKEVVGRHDIIPIKTEEWIHVLEPEFHSVVDLEEFEETNAIKFTPLDACRFEVMRFRTILKRNRELPLQVSARTIINDKHVEIRADVLIPGYFSTKKKEGQIPCEDIEIRFPIPEEWIYLFRVEKRFGYGSIKSALRKPGKIKGLERITMMAQGALTPTLIEVSSGSAKYEHVYKCVVWRIARLPDKNEGAYKTHIFVLRLDLGPHDIIPDNLEPSYNVEFTMPNTTISRAQVRSISSTSEDPPEKWVNLKGHYSYQVEMEFVYGVPSEPQSEVLAEAAAAVAASSESGESSEDEPEKEKEWKSDFSSDSEENVEEAGQAENEGKGQSGQAENVEQLLDI